MVFIAAVPRRTQANTYFHLSQIFGKWAFSVLKKTPQFAPCASALISVLIQMWNFMVMDKDEYEETALGRSEEMSQRAHWSHCSVGTGPR